MGDNRERDEPIATVVVRNLDNNFTAPFVDLLKLRGEVLESVRNRILLPRLTEDADDAVLLPATGVIITPLSRLRDEYRRSTAEFWILVDIQITAREPKLPSHLIGIGLDPACRRGADVLVGIIDSGIDLEESDSSTVARFAIADKRGHITIPQTPKDFHVQNAKEPTDGWYHGSQVSSRIGGLSEGVAPRAALVGVAALTEIDRDRIPIGTLAQFLAALSWLLTTKFRREWDPIGCDVVNASLSILAKSEDERRAVAYVIGLASKANILIVCAAGAAENPGGVPLEPLAAHSSTLAVGALDAFLRFSNHNLYDTASTKPEICAPGPSTSLATPLVTGACALLLEQDPTLRESAAELKAHVVQRFSKQPVISAPPALQTVRLALDGVCRDGQPDERLWYTLPRDTFLTRTVECRLPGSDIEANSFHAYLGAIDEVLVPLKEPIITRLVGDGGSVVDVQHTPFVVVTASVAQWLAWTGSRGWLAANPAVTVLSEAEVRGDQPSGGA